MTATLAFVISQSHIPKEARPRLTAALINDIRTYEFNGDVSVHKIYAMAIISMGQKNAVEKVLRD
ncbi:MAG: hypothetical protein WC582_02640 [Patescibacteria group bacterium]